MQFHIKSTAGLRGFGDAYIEIFLALLILTIPLLVLAGVLLSLIFSNRVVQSSAAGSLIPCASTEKAGVYYVDYDATRLITVASWASSLAPLLPSLVMTLLSFRIAAIMKRKPAVAGETKKGLPTPYQLSLLMELFNGSVIALWNWGRICNGRIARSACQLSILL
jgi:hypothetical protein